MSLISISNRSGPSIDPYGTPAISFNKLKLLFTPVLYKCWIKQLQEVLAKASYKESLSFKFCLSKLWLSVSDAFEGSMKVESIKLPLSKASFHISSICYSVVCYGLYEIQLVDQIKMVQCIVLFYCKLFFHRLQIRARVNEQVDSLLYQMDKLF